MSKVVDKKTIKLLSKSLASDSMSIRLKAIDRITSFFLLDDFEVGYEQAIWIWKGLFYALWQQDKLLLQEKVVAIYVDLIPRIKNFEKRSNYIAAAWETLVREWDNLDSHRIDKFMMLARDIFKRAIRSAKNKNHLKALCNACFEKVLNEHGFIGVGFKIFFASMIAEEFEENEFSLHALMLFINTGTATYVTLDKKSSYSVKVSWMINSLLKTMVDHPKVTAERLAKKSQWYFNMIEKNPGYRKALTHFARFLHTRAVQFATETEQALREIESISKNNSGSKKHKLIEEDVAQSGLEAEDMVEKYSKSAAKKVKLTIEKSSKNKTPPKKHAKDDLDKKSRRVSFGKIYRKKFKPNKTLVTPSTVSPNPNRSILRVRKSL